MSNEKENTLEENQVEDGDKLGKLLSRKEEGRGQQWKYILRRILDKIADVRAWLLGDSRFVETSKRGGGKYVDAVVPQMYEEVVVVQFKLQCWHFPEGTEVVLDMSQSV
jgi:hypothetical protein